MPKDRNIFHLYLRIQMDWYKSSQTLCLIDSLNFFIKVLFYLQYLFEREQLVFMPQASNGCRLGGLLSSCILAMRISVTRSCFFIFRNSLLGIIIIFIIISEYFE